MELWILKLLQSLWTTSKLSLVNHLQRYIINKPSKSQSIRKRKFPSFEHEAKPSMPSYEFPKTKMDISDVFLCTSTEEVQVGFHYDSTFSLMHWIRHCKAIIRLFNKNTSSLFWNILFSIHHFLWKMWI